MRHTLVLIFCLLYCFSHFASAYVTVPSRHPGGTFTITFDKTGLPLVDVNGTPSLFKQWIVEYKIGTSTRWNRLHPVNMTKTKHDITLNTPGQYQFRARGYNSHDCFYHNCGERFSDWGRSDYLSISKEDSIPDKVIEEVLSTHDNINDLSPVPMSYSSGVSAQGSSYISIPVPAPQGVTIQPNISLEYNSGRSRFLSNAQLPEDTLGEGWYLGGFSRIHRCTVGTTREITLDNNDRLCVDGQLLVPYKSSSTAYWSASRYRLEDASQQLLVSRAGNVFTMRMGDGTTRKYGGTTNTRVRQKLSSTQYSAYFTWYMSSESDAFDNAISYNYFLDERNGVAYPTSVVYGNGSSVIEFKYVTREELVPRKLHNSNINQSALLHRINIKQDGEKTGEMRLIPDSSTQAWRRIKSIQY